MEQSHWEAASSSVRQECRSTCILWNPKFHYRVHNRPPIVPVLSQINPGRTLISCSVKIHFTRILPCMSWFSKWCLPFRFPLLPCMYHMPRPAHHPCIRHLNNIWWAVEIMKLLSMQFFPCSVFSSLLGPDIFLIILFSMTLSLCSSHNVSDQVAHPYTATGMCLVLCV